MKYLRERNISYFSHLKDTFGLFLTFQKLALVAIIHAIIPDLFTSTILEKIKELDKWFKIREAKFKCCKGFCSCH